MFIVAASLETVCETHLLSLSLKNSELPGRDHVLVGTPSLLALPGELPDFHVSRLQETEL